GHRGHSEAGRGGVAVSVTVLDMETAGLDRPVRWAGNMGLRCAPPHAKLWPTFGGRRETG
ncbi:MAG: hypothetical protein R6U98_36410, partial [Pirellulaceae bacterium]